LVAWYLARGSVPIIFLEAGWAAFIEVKDWEDSNNNYVVDSCDEFSGPYWLEITGFGVGSGTDYEPCAWSEFGFYLNETEAADAAGTAIWCAWQYGIPGVLPTPQEVAGLVCGVTDPYNR